MKVRRRGAGVAREWREDLFAFDDFVEVVTQRIAMTFKRRKNLAEFFGPALLAVVGCVVFSLFDRLASRTGGGHLFGAFSQEHVTSLGHPYFLLGLFLLAANLAFGSPSGKGFFGPWIVASFLKLGEHVTMLGLGILVCLTAVEQFREFGTASLAGRLVLAMLITAVAALLARGAAFCKGEYAEVFEGRLGRQVLLRFAGAVLAVAGLHDMSIYVAKVEHEGHAETSTVCREREASEQPHH